MGEKINRLKSVLADKDITQKELAEKLSVSQNTISRICTNETQPSLKLLRKMAIMLDVELCDLLVPIKSRK
jgi:putative transcriptional regulator